VITGWGWLDWIYLTAGAGGLLLAVWEYRGEIRDTLSGR
jgi:hypothetical protein